MVKTLTKKEFVEMWHDRMGPGETLQLFDKLMQIYNDSGNTHSDMTHNQILTAIVEALELPETIS
jgi:hypothetical protein